ncbi:hypothetical protein ACLB2K_067766 [Fragaria x ananassa]
MAMSKERLSQELPDDILQSIAQRLYISDYQVFRQVCPNWRAAVDRSIATRSCLPASQPPWLLLLDSPGIWSRLPTDTSWPLIETRHALVCKDLEIIDRKLYVVGIRDDKYTVLLEFDILPEDDNDVTRAKYNCSISIGIPINWNERPYVSLVKDSASKMLFIVLHKSPITKGVRVYKMEGVMASYPARRLLTLVIEYCF